MTSGTGNRNNIEIFLYSWRSYCDHRYVTSFHPIYTQSDSLWVYAHSLAGPGATSVVYDCLVYSAFYYTFHLHLIFFSLRSASLFLHEVLRSACLHVCLLVCPLAYLKDRNGYNSVSFGDSGVLDGHGVPSLMSYGYRRCNRCCCVAIDNFSGPDRAVGAMCVCVSLCLDSNFWTKWS